MAPGPKVWALLLLAGYARATALTAMFTGRTCYYADVDGVGEKVGFYFAVQSGGDFDIDFAVRDPDEKVLLEGDAERQGDYIFTANKLGEYSFCFDNAENKLVDFDIMVESEPRRMISAQQPALKEHTSALEESTYKINGLLSSIVRSQKYAHTRFHRNMATVLSTKSRIFWLSVLECVVVVAMTLAQIWILKTFFSKTGKRYKV